MTDPVDEVDQTPRIGVCQNKYVSGARSLHDSVKAMTCMTLTDAMTARWDEDSHFTTYQVTNSELWPRCNKILLPKVRAIGEDILTVALSIDYDTPGHIPLTQKLLDGLVGSLRDAATRGLALATNWTYAYTTKGGLRLVYVLEHPIPVDEGESYVRGAVNEFRSRGVMVDELHDWSRVYRLPSVMRDNQPSWEAPLFDFQHQPGNRLDLRTIPAVIAPATQRQVSQKFEELDLPMPEPSEALSLLTELSSKSGKQISTEWLRKAKQRLRNKECGGCLFGDEDIAPEGERHTTIFRYVGQAAGTLCRLEGTTPELIFALFVPAGFRIDRKTCRRDPFETIWQAVLFSWSRQQSRLAEEEKQAQLNEEGKTSVQRQIIEGVRGWCDHPALHGEDDGAIDWMQEKMIACAGDYRYVMMRNGYYDSMPVRSTLLPARIRELEMDDVIPIVSLDPKSGTWKEVHPQTLVSRHGTILADIEGVASTPGTTIKDLGAARPVMQLRMYGLRTDLEPAYSQEVDQWLHALGGDTHYTRLKHWIGLALDFNSGPICALSIQGPPSIGKGMLSQGLAECVDTELLAGTHEFGTFQADLMKTPFLVVNEGFPAASPGAKDPADTFRALVDGTPTKAREMYKPIMTIRNPVRIVFAANNEDVVQMLAGRRDLSPEDQEALAIRLYHFQAGGEAARHLKNKGGLAFTGHPGRRWIRGQSGEPSDYVLARHFLHLYEERPPVPSGNRLLMEGSMDSDLIRRLSSRSGSAPDVIEALIRFIEAELPGRDDLVVLPDGKVYTTIAAVVNYHRDALSHKTRSSLKAVQVGNTLRGLREPGTVAHPDPFTLPTDLGDRRTRWIQLDVKKLWEEAAQYGHNCNRLIRILENQDKSKVVGDLKPT